MTGTISSSASNSAAELTSKDKSILKAKSNDIGWEYAKKADPKNADKVQCLLCDKIMSGGIYRMKEHIAHIKGNATSCPKSTDEDRAKCLKAIEDAKAKKNQKASLENDLRKGVIIEESEMDVEMEEEEEEEDGGTRMKKRKFLGPMDRYASKIDPSKKTGQPQITNVALFKERTLKVQEYVARWAYENSIPFNAIDNDGFKMVSEAIGQFGPGFKPPTTYQLRGSLLIGEKNRTKSLLKKQEEEWKKNGCSIMTDAWSDRKRRSIMNLCVNCPEGTAFLSSKESSHESHTGQYIFEYVDKCIEDVGSQCVVQVVTDNASNNMAAKDLLKLKRPSIFWTSCATHTINLMLQEIGNLPIFKSVIDKAKSFTIFIYAHHTTLSMMRKFTKRRDIVRPGVTRFASAFLTLQSLDEKKNELKAMVASVEWGENKHGKSVKGKAMESIALSRSFWGGVRMCLDVFEPLVKVLRLVDGEQKPSMGFLYEEMHIVREEIKKVFKNKETHYMPIFEIIDRKGHGRIDTPLHLAGCLLNPYYTYVDPSIASDVIVMNGFLECVERMFKDDVVLQDKLVNEELHIYLNKEGAFRKPMALAGCSRDNENYQPVKWWSVYGNHVPRLQNMAKRVLGLTTSSSGCERAWSTFEGIHTKKRNRLDVERLNNLVYVQFNARIFTKKKRRQEKVILVSKDSSHAQGWVVEGGDDDIASDEEIRELEEDFVSDEEEDENVNFEFEDENDEVLNIELERNGGSEEIDLELE